MRRLAVQPRRPGPIVRAAQIKSKFRRDDQLFTKRRERFAEQSFICEWPINFSGIKKRNPAFPCRMKQRRHLPHIFRRAVGKTHPHATQAEDGNFQITFSEFVFLHDAILHWQETKCGTKISAEAFSDVKRVEFAEVIEWDRREYFRISDVPFSSAFRRRERIKRPKCVLAEDSIDLPP